VDFFRELQSSHRILGPIYSGIFGFIVTCVSLNLLLYILNLSLHNAKRLCEEKTRQWNIFALLKRLFVRCRRNSDDSFPPDSISPTRMKILKVAAADYFRQCLKSTEAKTLKKVKLYTNQFLHGSGWHALSRKSRKYHEQLIKESQMIEMRKTTAVFLVSRIGAEMNDEEFESYACFNREVVRLRVQKLDRGLEKITEKVRKLNLSLSNY